MRKIFISLFIFLLSFSCFGQMQANIWHFGDGRCLDFSSGTPVNTLGSQIVAYEGTASYCDKYGHLLFYTNGGGREPFSQLDPGHIWNSDNAVMYDMQGIEGGGFSAAQAAVIFEAPGQDSIYYVFTMDEVEYFSGASNAIMATQPVGRGLSYFTVDMRLNAGLGSVVLANQPVKRPSYEGLCAIRHSNKKDYWVLINEDSTGIGVYSVTQSGVSFAGSFPHRGVDVIKASPNGAKVMTLPYVFDFNNSTGQLSNQITLPLTDTGFNEFSPNSRFLYALQAAPANTAEIIRYDLLSANIVNSATRIGSTSAAEMVGQIQLAPDGKIYFITLDFTNEKRYISRINCPNTFSASVEANIFTYQTPTHFYGLPNFPAWLFENYDSVFVSLGPDSIRLCDVDGSYTLNAGNPGAAYLWSTGAISQTITVVTPGIYSVTVTGNCGIGTDSIRITDCPPPVCYSTSNSLTVVNCGNYTAPSGSILNTSGVFNDTIPNIAGCDSLITINLTIKQNSASFITAASCNFYTTPSGKILTAAGIFKDTILNATGCDSLITINLTIKQSSSFITAASCNSYTSPSGKTLTASGIFKDTIPNVAGCDSLITINLTIKQNSSHLITAASCNSYTSPSGKILIASGIFKDTIPNATGCDSVITINLTINSNITNGLLTVTNCKNYTTPGGKVLTTSGIFKDTIPNSFGCDSLITINLTIKQNSASFITTESCNKYISPDGSVFTKTGTYKATIANANGCDSVITINITINDCLPSDCILYVPTAFSPGIGDLNNGFSPITKCPMANFEFMIFNRWGQLIYKTNNPSLKWDGKYKEKDCTMGVYVYLINYQFLSQPRKNLSGYITLIR